MKAAALSLSELELISAEISGDVPVKEVRAMKKNAHALQHCHFSQKKKSVTLKCSPDIGILCSGRAIVFSSWGLK